MEYYDEFDERSMDEIMKILNSVKDPLPKFFESFGFEVDWDQSRRHGNYME